VSSVKEEVNYTFSKAQLYIRKRIWNWSISRKVQANKRMKFRNISEDSVKIV